MTIMNKVARHFLSFCLFSILHFGTLACSRSVPLGPSPAGLSIAGWSEEFEGVEGTLPDPTRWAFDLGNNGGWGNRELQRYTAGPRNAHLDGRGHLRIRVEKNEGEFTSARVNSQGLVSVGYGRVEARIKLPFGQGIWPAFWMLGTTFDGHNWPQCGEIDVMESRGGEPDTVRGTIHGPGYSGGNGITGQVVLPAHGRLADDFHVFTVERSPGTVRFLMDGMEYNSISKTQIPSGASWVFDQPFFVLLNVAVGGDFPGPPDASTSFPQEMLVDYVRFMP